MGGVLEMALRLGFKPTGNGTYVVSVAAIEALFETARLVGRKDMERCGGCGAVRSEPCKRGAPGSCFRAFHGGSFEPVTE